MPSSDVAKPDNPANIALSKLFTSPLDARITQLTKILSTAPGIDSTFCFLGYSLVFASSQLSLLASHPPNTLLSRSTTATTKGHPAAAALWREKLTELSVSAKTLGGVCSDVRTFLRLWGLLKIYLGAKAAYLSPPKDKLLRVISWGQLSSMAAYYYLENRVYLTNKGVLKGWDAATVGKRLRVAIWLFVGYLVLDFLRLGRVWHLQAKEVAAADADEKEAKLAREEVNRAWWRSLQVNLGYFPLSFHWGTPGGLLTPWWADFWVGLLGATAGFAGFREQLRVTAP